MEHEFHAQLSDRFVRMLVGMQHPGIEPQGVAWRVRRCITVAKSLPDLGEALDRTVDCHTHERVTNFRNLGWREYLARDHEPVTAKLRILFRAQTADATFMGGVLPHKLAS